MNLGRKTTTLLIILLIVVGIVGTYYMMGWSGNWYFYGQNQVSYSEADLKDYVSEYIDEQFGPAYEASDIFVFSDSPYYISVKEKNSGRGAFELLFDPDTRSFRPEPGPNMMWNQKYGMMGRRWMGLNRGFQADEENQVSRKEALEYSREYLDKERPDIDVSNEGHEFYGYYTFHTLKDGKPYGMLSVNGITGDVWYHDWHGKLEKVIEVEQSEHEEE